ncbi:DNA polymerase IV [Dorcoceras hygrometricum]|uniref:DNA polymerase IV n=1 Tax=Dorcoceras hygrometricum TaxID=472368 RepID=A0A2Z7C3Y6_9LAMI|nr:DNA polymerase IV [Dorcoceras hygrometricum]
MIVDRSYDETAPPQASHGRPSTSPKPHGHAPPPRHHATSPHDRTCSDRRAEVIPSVANPSSLLVQIDGGRLIPVVDLIGGSTAAYREEPDFPSEFLVGARRLDARKKWDPDPPPYANSGIRAQARILQYILLPELPLPANLAHWLHDIGAAGTLLCAKDGARSSSSRA